MTMQKVEAALEAAAHAMEWAQPHLEADPITEERGINEAHAHALAKVKDALALLRSDAEGERGGWKTIETAPKDGTPIILANFDAQCLLCGAPHVWTARYLVYEGETIMLEASYAASNENGDPTHWYPLPGATPSTPSVSDWEAGAEAMREACAQAAVADTYLDIRFGEIAKRIRTLPIPRRP